jgi:hypothetical protein
LEQPLMRAANTMAARVTLVVVRMCGTG